MAATSKKSAKGKQATAKTARPRTKAVMKAAPKRAAPKKAAPVKATAKPAKATAKPAKATAKPAKATAKPTKASSDLQSEILALARTIYGNQSDETLLGMDPNDIDAMDPSIFYELLEEKYGVAQDPNNDYFGGYGGTIAKTIAFIRAGWDEKTKQDTPTPPEDWLEEYVHPETAAHAAKSASSDEESFAE